MVDTQRDLVELGRAVRAERVRRGLTQRQLAEEVGVSKAAISHLEVARRPPTRELLEGVARALHTSVPELVAEAGERVPAAGLSVGGMYVPSASTRVGAVRAAHRRLQDLLGNDDTEETLHLRTSQRPGTQLPVWVREQPVGLKFDQAEGILRSPEAVAALIERVEGKLDELAADLGAEVVAVARLMARLVTCYADGEYRACRHEVAALLVGALTYLTEDDDAVPTATSDNGALDDIGVLVFTADWAADELDLFERWFNTVGPTASG